MVLKLAKKHERKYDEENRKKAEELYRKVLKLDPEGKKGTTDYGDSKVSCTEYAEFSLAELMNTFSQKRDPEPLKSFIKKYPESKLLKYAYLYLSSYYRFLGTKEEAKKFFEEYTSKYPDNPVALNYYIYRIIRDKDNLDRGIELAEKIKKLTEYNPVPSYMKNLAELYTLKGEIDKADNVYGKSFIEGRVSRFVYDLRDYADFWTKQNKNVESAVEMMELAVKLKPDNSYLIQSAARMYIKLDKLEKAISIYGPEFVKSHSGKSGDLNSYAWFWANQEKNLESALEAAKKSVELAPSHYNWDTLSLVYFKLKKYEDAIKAEEKAIELAGKPVKSYENRIKRIKEAMAKEKK